MAKSGIRTGKLPDFDVWFTPTADGDYRSLRRELRVEVDERVRELEVRGCHAAHYGLRGHRELERLCVIRLRRDWRMVLAFPAPNEVAVLVIGGHVEGRSAADLYRRLYRHLRLEPPAVLRLDDKHSPCCDDNEDVVDPALVDEFIETAKELVRAARRRK